MKKIWLAILLLFHTIMFEYRVYFWKRKYIHPGTAFIHSSKLFKENKWKR
jgi:hypothetical protein